MKESSKKDTEIIAELYPTPARYWFGIVAIGALGLFLIWIGSVAENLALLARLVTFASGGTLVWFAYKIYTTGRHGIVLTEAGLTDTSGNAICTIDSIHNVDRSFFAFKPSHGFLIRLNISLPFAWHPGLWWRFGKRVGVGGITPAATGKAMSDALAILLVKRDDPTVLDLD